VAINASTCALTFPRRVRHDHWGTRCTGRAPSGLEQHGDGATWCERVGHAPPENSSREVVDDGVQIGACPVEQADHHVPGLEIAVRDATLMRGTHRVGERDRIRKDPIDRQSAWRNDRLEGSPFDQLQGQERNASRFFDRINGDDVGMIQGSDSMRLALESFTAVRVHRQLARQHLESHATSESRVLGGVDLAHAALTEGFGDVVVTDAGSDQYVAP